MQAVLLSLLLAVQGIPILPNQGGKITGVLLSADGKPAVGVRVTAIPQTDTIAETANGGTLSSIAETDEQGRYTLESVPPGRYYVAAGRLDLPTYYPGTQGMASATTVQVTAGATLAEVNFTLNVNSAGRAPTIMSGGVTGITVPLDIRVVNGRMPVSSGGRFSAVVVTAVAGGTTVSGKFQDASMMLPLVGADYRVAVEGLPEGYTVRELKYGPADVLNGLLQITNSGLPRSNVASLTISAFGTFVTTLTGVRVVPPPTHVLSVVIDGAAASSASGTGVRVRGTIHGSLQRIIYISGVPGTVFSDGSFEFRNVVPGRHTIATLSNPPRTPALASTVIVGNEDLNGVEVESTPALPLNPRLLTTPGPAGGRPAGPVPLASIRGRVLDAETGLPVAAGTVFVVGDTWAPCPISAEGKFEFPRLLPGNYELEIQAPGYPTLRRPAVVDEQDLDIELRAG